MNKLSKSKIFVFLILSSLSLFIAYFFTVTMNSSSFAINYCYKPIFIYPILFFFAGFLLFLGISLFTSKNRFKILACIALLLSLSYFVIIYSVLLKTVSDNEYKQKVEQVQELLSASNIIGPTKKFTKDNSSTKPDTLCYALGDMLVYNDVQSYSSADNTSAYVNVYYFDNYSKILIKILSDEMKERYFFNQRVTGFYAHSSDIISKKENEYQVSYLFNTDDGTEYSKMKYKSYFSVIIEKDDTIVAVSMNIWHNDILEPQLMAENLIYGLSILE